LLLRYYRRTQEGLIIQKFVEGLASAKGKFAIKRLLLATCQWLNAKQRHKRKTKAQEMFGGN
jgi:hypothetical protein